MLHTRAQNSAVRNLGRFLTLGVVAATMISAPAVAASAAEAASAGTQQVVVNADGSISESRVVVFDTDVQTAYANSDNRYLRLGHIDDNGTSNTARSFLRFDTSDLAGAQITSARLQLFASHSWSCQPASWEAWRTGRADDSITWVTQPAAVEKLAVSTVTRGYGPLCDDAFVTIPVTNAVAVAAASGAADATVMLRATSETTSVGWKRFDSSEGEHPPVLLLTYTR